MVYLYLVSLIPSSLDLERLESSVKEVVLKLYFEK